MPPARAEGARLVALLESSADQWHAPTECPPCTVRDWPPTSLGNQDGTFSHGLGGEQIAIEAVDFGRAVSGRDNPTGLLSVSIGS